MAKRGLFARLAADCPAEPVAEIESVLAHLRVLLNTALGDSPCASDLGVVDFMDLVHDFPAASYTLQRSIRDTIHAYEPRLQAVLVSQIESDDPMTLSFQISARVESASFRGPIHLRTNIQATGQIEVR